MKKVFTVVALLACATLSKAQERQFKPFKVVLTTGYASSTSAGSTGGVLFSAEPKYALTDQLSLGLRVEAAAVFIAKEKSMSIPNAYDGAGISSLALTSDYYFGTKKSRLFAGVGAGIFKNTASIVDSQGERYTLVSYSKFGVFPRIGAELAHFRVGLEYNLVPKYTTESDVAIPNSYFTLKVGICIGGGKL
jgi:hypothetical protein